MADEDRRSCFESLRVLYDRRVGWKSRRSVQNGGRAQLVKILTTSEKELFAVLLCVGVRVLCSRLDTSSLDN